MAKLKKEDPAGKSYLNVNDYFGATTEKSAQNEPSEQPGLSIFGSDPEWLDSSENLKAIAEVGKDKESDEISIQEIIKINKNNLDAGSYDEPFEGSDELSYVCDSVIESTTSESEGIPRSKRHLKQLFLTLEGNIGQENNAETNNENLMNIDYRDDFDINSPYEPFVGSDDTPYTPGSIIESTTSEDMPVKKKRLPKKRLRSIQQLSTLEENIENNNENNMNIDNVQREVENNVPLEAENTFKQSTDRKNVYLIKVENTTGIRKWDKKHACLFCKQVVSKLPRHLESKHYSEKEVLEFLLLPKKSKERKEKIEEIRQLGNYAHNANIISMGDGQIIPKKRSTKERNLDSMAPCKFCMGLYAKKDIYQHFKRCSKNAVDRSKSRIRCSMFYPMNGGATDDLKKDVLSTMREDKIFHIIRSDSTILKFGSNLHAKHKAHPHLKSYISQRMRQLGRLLMEIKEISPEIDEFSRLIHPNNFDAFIEGIKGVSLYENNDNSYGIPSLALRLRSSVQDCAAILKSDSIKMGLLNRRKEIDDFTDLLSMNFTTQISSHALNTVYNKKWNKEIILPLTEDLKLLTEYLKVRALDLMENMESNITAESWCDICEVTLAQTLIFNRRRAGEVERVFLKTYLNKDDAPMNDNILESLTDIEKHLAKTLTRFETRGKRGRKVPILLTHELKQQIDILCSTRNDVQITEENPYLFANVKTTGFVRSGAALKKFTQLCGAKNPGDITSTNLRKHVATTCQLLNLKDNEMDQLATYMGHDIRVHRQFYRLPDSSIQLSKVSKLLLSLDGGNIKNNKGRNFDNILLPASSDVQLPISSDSENETPNLEAEIENDESEIILKKAKTSNTKVEVKKVDKQFRSTKESDTRITMEKGDRLLRNTRRNKSNANVITEKEDRQLLLRNRTISKPANKAKNVKNETKKTLKITKNNEENIKKPKIKKVEWTPMEKDAITRQMAVYWIRKKVPNKEECEKCLQNEPELKNRTWRHVKYYVYNVIQKNYKK